MKIKIGEERTFRRNGKWAKVIHLSHGHYKVAFGFKGNFKACRVQQGKHGWAQIARDNWFKDP